MEKLAIILAVSVGLLGLALGDLLFSGRLVMAKIYYDNDADLKYLQDKTR